MSRGWVYGCARCGEHYHDPRLGCERCGLSHEESRRHWDRRAAATEGERARQGSNAQRARALAETEARRERALADFRAAMARYQDLTWLERLFTRKPRLKNES